MHRKETAITISKMLHLLVIALGLFCAGTGTNASVLQQKQYKLSFGDRNVAFQDWKEKFAHVHGENWDENERFEIFSDNLAKIEKHNWLYHTKQSTFYMGLNQFSAMTNDEYQRYNRLGKYSKKHQLTSTESEFKCVELQDGLTKAESDNIPDAIDWAKEGYVTPVKDQKGCASCWTFSTTGAMEGAYFKTHKELKSFSEQQILDCCKLEDCGGCHGGFVELAYAYIHNAQGLESETDYPYEAQTEGNCKVNKSKLIGSLTTCYKITPNGSEDALKSAVAKYGPISVAIDGHLDTFKHYEAGVYYDPQCSSDPTVLNHAVLVTGYATSDDKQDYWIVKNSYGETFGQRGYIWMARNKQNACGIADNYASFPVFK